MNRITIIGSGNVATHLACAFQTKGCGIGYVCSRTLAHAQALAQRVGAQASDRVEELPPADLYIIAVTDSAIREVADRLNAGHAPVVHTAGSIPLTALDKFPRAGVLYPLQTFSRRHEVHWATTPVFIEARDDETLSLLKAYALHLSPNVRVADSALRLRLHTAAVFACNFVNSLLSVASDLSGEHFPALYPVVCETVEKAFAASHPRDVQTGPAARNDRDTMSAQRSLLPPEYRLLYDELSDVIVRRMQNPPHSITENRNQ